MSAIKYWVWLSSRAEVSALSKARLMQRYGDAETIYYLDRDALRQIPGLTKAEAADLEKRDLSTADKILGECERLGLQVVTWQDAAYSKRLKYISAPPAVLYVKGRLPVMDDEAAIAVIGTRKATPYGLKMARDIAEEIVRCGGVVISGLTAGIDAMAAQGALSAGGSIVGVLGTSHDAEKGNLAADVAAYGALVSEYPPGSPTYRYYFRERNRVASGLSVGVVVVEAPERSGARLFANEANEQGRVIFAVPGNADAPNSVGTLAMMQEGAKPVATGWDVLSEFEALYPGKLHREPVEKQLPEPVTTPASPKKDIDSGEAKGYIDLRQQLSGLTEDQLKIIAAIDKSATHIDDIIEATGLGTAKVLAQLTVLEIKGFVRREAGRRVTLNTAKK